MDIPTQFDFREAEPRIYAKWLSEKAFTPKGEGKPFVVIQPPPNVTGVLHIGHALTCTLEDIMTRHKRMQGFDALWLPGTDHAGIATQMVVERMIQKEEGKTKHDLGREEFLKRVWAWKEKSQTTILSQMKLIGCSVDWSRLKFTLDEDVSIAVRETFTRLYNEKLLYRDTAIIQWCPRCRTALSDLEVKAKEVKGKIWHIKYVLKDDPNQFVVVATTRPETLLGDTAVAVHPEDERFQQFHGKQVLVPLVNRAVPLIVDDYVDKEFGTGALKITPGHDTNDYTVGRRHGLPVISIFDDKAALNENGGVYQGLSREKAREKILADLTDQGLLLKDVEHINNVGHCDRCSTVVEPKVSQQWFVNAAELAKEAIRVVEQKEIRIVPEEWEKTYFEWMRNIRPWCVSRQLWWGHRIPAWHCTKCAHIEVAVEAPTKCSQCNDTHLKQDDDVLDTWFSSGLWPFSTLGWPKETADMKQFYPTSVMETGFDILFFWVARMIMLGIKMTGKIPFHTVYLHPMVRDEYGQKMSKTKGNVKDPLEIIDSMGADALRFTLASMAVQGRDVLLSDARIEGYRNFVTKLWNAYRFVFMNFEGVTESKIDTDNEVNRWILSRLNQCTRDVNTALDQYRFFEAAERVYHFVWNEYCDWFIELMKEPKELEARKQKKDSTAVEVLEQIVKLLHPFMPFVTEEIWSRLKVKEDRVSLAVSSYPHWRDAWNFEESERNVARVIELVSAVRSKRGENNVAPSKPIAVTAFGDSKIIMMLGTWAERIEKLNSGKLTLQTQEPALKGQVLIPLTGFSATMPLSDLVDPEVEKARVKKELEGLHGELTRANAKLNSEAFTGKAPQSVIDGVQTRKTELQAKVQSLTQYLKELGG